MVGERLEGRDHDNSGVLGEARGLEQIAQPVDERIIGEVVSRVQDRRERGAPHGGVTGIGGPEELLERGRPEAGRRREGGLEEPVERPGRAGLAPGLLAGAARGARDGPGLRQAALHGDPGALGARRLGPGVVVRALPIVAQTEMAQRERLAGEEAEDAGVVGDAVLVAEGLAVDRGKRLEAADRRGEAPGLQEVLAVDPAEEVIAGEVAQRFREQRRGLGRRLGTEQQGSVR